MTTAKKILNLRKNQGLSQEELADRASINLRTLQRIEQGHTEPRGQTLRLLAQALGQSPENLVLTNPTQDLKNDPTFLQFLNLSALSYWLIPFGNLIFPAVLYWRYRDSITGIREIGKSLLRFQILWSCLCYSTLAAVITSSIFHPDGMNPLLPFYLMIGIGILYLFNTVLIIIAAFQIKRGNKPFYARTIGVFRRQAIISKIAVIIFLVAGIYTSVAAQTKEPPRPLGQLIDLGGWRLHLYGQGMQHAGGPSVVLEAGIGDFSFDWTLVQAKVADFARVYSYDRAGSAWSDLGPRPHTMQQAVYELHTLLQKAHVPKPYLLVGASYGGILVRLFEQTYPNEVAGLVLVDSGTENGRYFINGHMLSPEKDAKGEPIPPVKTIATPEDNNLAKTPEAIKAIGDALNKMGLPAKQVSGSFAQLPDSIQQIRIWALSNYEYYAASDNPYLMDELLQMIKVKAQRPQTLGNKPLIVLTRGRAFTNDTEADEQKRLQDQIALTQLSSNSKQIIARNSGHHIQLDEPEVVVEAIREVITKVKLFK